MKGVILSGGFGSRMSPISKVVNKHLLPVYSHSQGAVPMLYYPVNTLVRSGVKDILIITSDEAAGLVIETMGDGSKFNADFTYKIQNMHNPLKPCGIASALFLSKNFVGNDKFSVILGDNFYQDEFSYDILNFEQSNNLAHVFLKSVHDIKRFGCASVMNNKIVDIVEKPKNPKSDLAVTGLYLFTPDVFEVAQTLKPSDRNEMEISDINLHYAKKDLMSYTTINGFWKDMGTPISMKETDEFINKNDFRYNF